MANRDKINVPKMQSEGFTERLSILLYSKNTKGKRGIAEEKRIKRLNSNKIYKKRPDAYERTW